MGEFLIALFIGVWLCFSAYLAYKQVSADFNKVNNREKKK